MFSLWNELGMHAIHADKVGKFKINLSKYGYQRLIVVITQISVFLTTINIFYVILIHEAQNNF